jgi:hypothetical protein
VSPIWWRPCTTTSFEVAAAVWQIHTRDHAPVTGVHGAVYKVLQKSSGVVYDSVRGVTKLVGKGLDATFEHMYPELAHINSSNERAADFVGI